MSIDVKYYANEYPVTVRFGYYELGEFVTDICNHAGNLEKEKAYTFDGYNDGEFYYCKKCQNDFEIWEIESDPCDSDWEYQCWKDSQL